VPTTINPHSTYYAGTELNVGTAPSHVGGIVPCPVDRRAPRSRPPECEISRSTRCAESYRASASTSKPAASTLHTADQHGLRFRMSFFITNDRVVLFTARLVDCDRCERAPHRAVRRNHVHVSWKYHETQRLPYRRILSFPPIFDKEGNNLNS